MLTPTINQVLLALLSLLVSELLYIPLILVPTNVVAQEDQANPSSTTENNTSGGPATKSTAATSPSNEGENDSERPPPKPVEPERPTIKLSPGVRIIEQQRILPMIPAETIQHFLNRPKIITPAEIGGMGYIIGNVERSVFATVGNQIYVLGLDHPRHQQHYMILSLGQPYQGPQDEQPLAYEAIYLGDADLEKVGEGDEPSVLKVTTVKREIEIGARLLPVSEQTITEDFYPHVPAKLEEGYIVGLIDSGTQSGQYQIVVVNKGSSEGLERGHLLSVYKTEDTTIIDKIGEDSKPITLPARQAGTLLVFKVFEEVSYALVMKSTLPINRFDKVTVP